MNYPWTWCQERTEQLRKHHAAGLSFSVIAGLFKTTRSAIAGKCARLGLARPGRDNVANGRLGGKIRAKQIFSLAPSQRKAPSRQRKPKFNFARAITPRAMNGTAGLSVLVGSDAPPSLNISLVDLEPRHCRFIPGDDRLFCGQPKQEGSSYCAHHDRMCRP